MINGKACNFLQTGNLDPANSWEIMKLLQEANERGTTVIVVTHNHEIVKAMNKRVVMMEKGNIVYDSKYSTNHAEWEKAGV